MGHFKDIRLSRWGAVLLAAVSLAATIVILAGGGDKSNVVLAAQTALKHRPQEVEEVIPPAPTVTVTSPSTSPAVSPPSSGSDSDSGSGGSNSSSSSGSTGSGSANSGGSGTGSSGSDTTSTAQTTTTTTTTTTAAPDAGLPKVGHVFLLTLSTTDYKAAFGAGSDAPYLRGLAKRGTVLSGYHALGKAGLVDLVAMLSGQPPNRDTSADCVKYTPFATSATLSTAGIAKGAGCIYPDGALTVADQATAAGKSWGAYVDGEGANNCPVPNTGELLNTPLDGTTAGYDVAHNPFAFFGSLLDTGGCSEYDEDLSNLPKALAKKSATPAFTYVAGNACVDGDPVVAPAATTTAPAGTVTGADGVVTTTPGTVTTTAGVTTTSTLPARLIAPSAYGCPAGDPSGLAAEDTFLKTWVPKILSSAAYRANGVLVIAFTGAGGKATADTGALVLSRWTPKAKRIKTAYTAYSLLHSVEDMLDLTALAKAAAAPAFAKLVLR